MWQETTAAAEAPVPVIPLRTAPPRVAQAVDGLTVSVIVCAYTLDRWDDMTAALDSIRGQVRPADELILVVDHCPELAARAGALLPGVRVVASRGLPGLSGARNTGVAEAHSSILAFLDDDAVADPYWTRRLLACYSNQHVLGVGGSIQPRWDARRPVWFPAEFDWVIGCSYRGMPQERSPVRNFLGANMSFRREVLVSDGGFRSDLGRSRGRRPLGCEETELCIRALAENPESVLLYEPDATVRHRVPRQRATWSYFRARCFAEGLSKAAMVRQTGTRRGLSTERSYVWSTIPSALFHPPRDDGRPWLATVPAVVAGVVVTAVGYLVGRLRVTRIHHRRA